MRHSDDTYGDWVDRRYRLVTADDIKSVTHYKKGRKLPNAVVCSLCGRRLSSHDFNNNKDVLKVASIYLSTGTFLHYYICERADSCFKNHLERENRNGRK